MLHPPYLGPANSAPPKRTQGTVGPEFDPAGFGPANRGPTVLDPAEESLKTAASTPIPQKNPVPANPGKDYEYNNNNIKLSDGNYSYSHIQVNSESVPAEDNRTTPAETAASAESPEAAENAQQPERSRNDTVAADGNNRSPERQRSTYISPRRTAGSNQIAKPPDTETAGSIPVAPAVKPLDKEAVRITLQNLDEAVRTLAQISSPPDKYNPNYIAAMLRDYRDVHLAPSAIPHETRAG